MACCVGRSRGVTQTTVRSTALKPSRVEVGANPDWLTYDVGLGLDRSVGQWLCVKLLEDDGRWLLWKLEEVVVGWRLGVGG